MRACVTRGPAVFRWWNRRVPPRESETTEQGRYLIGTNVAIRPEPYGTQPGTFAACSIQLAMSFSSSSSSSWMWK